MRDFKGIYLFIFLLAKLSLTSVSCFAFDSPFAPMFIFGIFQTDNVVVYRHFNSHERKKKKKNEQKNQLGWRGGGGGGAASQLSLQALQGALDSEGRSCLLQDKHNLQVHLHNTCLGDAARPRLFVCLRNLPL